jgi:hypothetical protein
VAMLMEVVPGRPDNIKKRHVNFPYQLYQQIPGESGRLAVGLLFAAVTVVEGCKRSSSLIFLSLLRFSPNLRASRVVFDFHGLIMQLQSRVRHPDVQSEPYSLAISGPRRCGQPHHSLIEKLGRTFSP